MKKWNFLLILALGFAACGPAPAGEIIPGCQATLDNLAALREGYEFPQHFQTENPLKQGGEFDVMQYFTVFDHLSMESGYALDYVYHFDGMGGYPVLYVRPTSQPAYATEADLSAAGETPSYLDHVRTDGTSEGYFQFVVLSITAGRFYLFWHANYNDRSITCDKAAVMDIVSSTNHLSGQPMPLKAKIQARFLQNVEPRLIPGEDTLKVQFVTFTMWGGFYLQTYTLSPSSPTKILDVQEKNLVPYDCGIMF